MYYEDGLDYDKIGRNLRAKRAAAEAERQRNLASNPRLANLKSQKKPPEKQQ